MSFCYNSIVIHERFKKMRYRGMQQRKGTRVITKEVMCKEHQLYLRSQAVFDATGMYRYSLERTWDLNLPEILFIMLNPSTADGQANDPTIRRCIQFARSWRFGSLVVVNLFAYKATHPSDLLKASDPIGNENNFYLLQTLARSRCIVAAWGTKGTILGRDREVVEMLAGSRSIYCLGLTKERHPLHPLYVKGNVELVRFL